MLINLCEFSFKEYLTAAFLLFLFLLFPAPLPRSVLAKEETLKEFDGQSIKIISNPNFCSHPDIEVSEGFPWH